MDDKIIVRMIQTLKSHGDKLIQKNDDYFFSIAINYFNDGECIDLGARIVICDSEEENFRDTYYSFTLGDDELAEPILEYIKAAGSENEYQRQQHLAECLKEGLLVCSWIDSRTDVYVEEYD